MKKYALLILNILMLNTAQAVPVSGLTGVWDFSGAIRMWDGNGVYAGQTTNLGGNFDFDDGSINPGVTDHSINGVNITFNSGTLVDNLDATYSSVLNVTIGFQTINVNALLTFDEVQPGQYYTVSTLDDGDGIPGVNLGLLLFPGFNGEIVGYLVPPPIPGDINADGSVDVSDLIMMQRYLSGIAGLNATELEQADLYPENLPDGKLTISDWLVMQKLITGG